MTYIEFECIIRDIQKEWDWNDKYYEVGLDVGKYAFGMDWTVRLLERILNDQDEILSWWVFEKNFGRDDRVEVRDEDKQIIPLKTTRDIWNLIVGDKDAI